LQIDASKKNLLASRLASHIKKQETSSFWRRSFSGKVANSRPNDPNPGGAMTGAISSQALSELIGSIYDCALDSTRWSRTLRELAEAFSGEWSGLALIDRRNGRLIYQHVRPDEAHIEEQTNLFPEMDVLLDEFVRHNFFDLPYVLSRHFEPNDCHAPYVQFVRTKGFIDTMTYALKWDSSYVSMFGIGRLEHQGIVTQREIELGGLLLPHLRRAVRISKVLDARAIEKQRMAEALDMLKCGVILTNSGGTILHANRVAEHIFRHGAPVQTVRGMLTANLPAAAKGLHNAIRLAAKDQGAIGNAGLAIRLNEDDKAPQFAYVLPLRRGSVRPRLEPQMAIFIGTSHDDADAAEALAMTFGLTRSEACLLKSLLAGHTLAESARLSGVALVTAKTHLKNIFQKTGVNRQAELVRLGAHAASPAGSR
jgi:DNA-binding CsgD family transcriptional regulator